MVENFGHEHKVEYRFHNPIQDHSAAMPKQSDDPDNVSVKSIQERILQMMDDGECTITEADGKTVYRIKPTKIGQKHGKSDSIEEINTDIVKGVILNRLKRIYRRKEDLPNSELGPKDEPNRLTKQFQARISPDHVKLFESVRDKFPNKRAAMERAVELLAREQGIDFEPES